MGWFTRLGKGITTDTKDKKEIKEGLWYSCPKCKKIVPTKDHTENFNVCTDCDHHERVDPKTYFKLLFDDGKYTEMHARIAPADPLKFVDTKKYTERIKASQKATGQKDAIINARGKINGFDLVVSAMDFRFIGGSMGSVVGEKIAKAVNYAIRKGYPYMIISQSGGARMMESAFSLMQMAKTSAKLAQLAENKLPYISLMTNPTTGGVTASFSMLGDINLAEPEALIGFAGPRVIKEAIGKDLPEGFQTAEFLLEQGFVDHIVHRKNLKKNVSQFLRFFAG